VAATPWRRCPGSTPTAKTQPQGSEPNSKARTSPRRWPTTRPAALGGEADARAVPGSRAGRRPSSRASSLPECAASMRITSGRSSGHEVTDRAARAREGEGSWHRRLPVRLAQDLVP
jgi:hypothetical protein